jgi:hypothetical protein
MRIPLLECLFIKALSRSHAVEEPDTNILRQIYRMNRMEFGTRSSPQIVRDLF